MYIPKNPVVHDLESIHIASWNNDDFSMRQSRDNLFLMGLFMYDKYSQSLKVDMSTFMECVCNEHDIYGVAKSIQKLLSDI